MIDVGSCASLAAISPGSAKWWRFISLTIASNGAALEDNGVEAIIILQPLSICLFNIPTSILESLLAYSKSFH